MWKQCENNVQAMCKQCENNVKTMWKQCASNMQCIVHCKPPTAGAGFLHQLIRSRPSHSLAHYAHHTHHARHHHACHHQARHHHAHHHQVNSDQNKFDDDKNSFVNKYLKEQWALSCRVVAGADWKSKRNQSGECNQLTGLHYLQKSSSPSSDVMV